MNNRTLIIALVLWAVLSFLLNLLTNLMSDILFPSLSGKPWTIVVAVLVALILSIPLSIYISVGTMPKESTHSFPSMPISDEQTSAPRIVSELQSTGQLPGKGYSELIGRDKYLGKIMSALRDPSGKWIVGIDGMGGIGKTALAREVAERCKKEHLFNSFVWIQAPKESFPLSNGDKGIGSLTFEAVLDNIARQFGALDVPKLKPPEKEARIKALLQTQRIIVVLDNLETAKESQDEIARKLKPLLNPSKALLTSRRRFKVDLFAVHLDDLKPDDAIRFVRQTARDRNITRVEGAEQEELPQIAQTTGSPLALKLIVGQLESQPLESVIHQIQKVKPPEKDSDEADYLKF